MALGFIKKVFSFGNKQAEETPIDEKIQVQSKEGKVEEAIQTHEVIKISASPLPAVSDIQEASELPIDEPKSDISPELDEPKPDAPTSETQEPEDITSVEDVVTTDIEPVVAADAVPVTEDDDDEQVPEQVPEQVTDEPTDQAIGDADDTSDRKVAVAQTVSIVEQAPSEIEGAEPEEKTSWFKRLREGLSRTSNQLSDQITGIFTKRKLDDDTLQDLEDVLIQSDLGLETAMRVTDALSATRYGKDVSTEDVTSIMAAEIEKVLEPVARPLELDLSHKPHVILVVGVNGTGKTTTIGKLAAKLTEGGLSVMLAAGDTFRAAAIEQLKIWGERTNSPVVSSKIGADAAGLAYDAFEQATQAGSDVLIIDTAGRLQNKTELMDELEKIVRVLNKHDPDAPHTVLQTLDATTGQNALSQVEIFRNVAGVNGLVMTKLDGTARGGILVAISAKHKLPVYFIGVGEGVDDLEPFAAKDFAEALAIPRAN